MKKLLVAGVSTLALLLALVLAIGAVMPRSHVAVSRIELRQPMDTVWKVVRDQAGLAGRWDAVERVERLPDTLGLERWMHHMNTGPLPISVEFEDPPRRLVTRIVVGEGAAFGGTWTYELETAGDMTAVTVRENGYVDNLVFRFVSRVFMDPHGTVDSYLRDLGRWFGAVVEPEHVTQVP